MRVLADHDAENRAVFAQAVGIATTPADKKVLEGIQLVQERLKIQPDGKPRLFIMRDAGIERDETLADARKPMSTYEEIMGYVWDTGAGKATTEQPLKKDDHGCLVAGTLIHTPAGEIPIEDVRPGDYVGTRAGWRRVLAAGMTNPSAPVVHVELGYGLSLTGTGNHPVWVDGKGFIRLDALRYSDRLLPWWTRSDSTASSSVDTPTRHGSPNATTTRPASPTDSAEFSTYTSRSGSRRTAARFRRAMRSTTPTSIRSTMTRATWSVSLAPSTRRLTANKAVSEVTPPSVSPCSTASAPSPRPGIPRRKVLPGTESMPPSLDSEKSSLDLRSVNSAALTISTNELANRASAPTTASRPGVAPVESTTSSASARVAESSSSSIATSRRRTALVSVRQITVMPEPVPVYNLTVADVPEYYANGILVHNCDALRYMIVDLDGGSKPRVRMM